MAIVFSYPPIGKNDVQPSDRLLLSQMTVDGNPTRSVTVNTLRQYLGAIIPTNIVTGVGTTNRLARWTNGPGGIIGDSGITDDGVSDVKVPYALSILNATSQTNGIKFEHPAGGASGIVNMYYNGAVAGSRFVISRAATGGAEIELQSNGDVNINRLGNGNFLVGGEVTLDDYGAGTITGTPTFYLAVDVNGKVIEETSAGGIGGGGTLNSIPVWTAANTLGDSGITDDGLKIEINRSTETGAEFDFNDVVKLQNNPGNAGDVFTSNGAGSAPDWTNPGYKAVQRFDWIPGGPTPAYNNWTQGTAWRIPVAATPQLDVFSGGFSAATHGWTAALVGAPAGSPVAFYSEFTLGAQGAGTWRVLTTQNWFDQVSDMKCDVIMTRNAVGPFSLIAEESDFNPTDNRIMYGETYFTFSAGDVITISVEFNSTVAPGINPFPSDLTNKRIGVSFERIV